MVQLKQTENTNLCTFSEVEDGDHWRTAEYLEGPSVSPWSRRIQFYPEMHLGQSEIPSLV